MPCHNLFDGLFGHRICTLAIQLLEMISYLAYPSVH